MLWGFGSGVVEWDSEEYSTIKVTGKSAMCVIERQKARISLNSGNLCQLYWFWDSDCCLPRGGEGNVDAHSVCQKLAVKPQACARKTVITCIAPNWSQNLIFQERAVSGQNAHVEEVRVCASWWSGLEQLSVECNHGSAGVSSKELTDMNQRLWRKMWIFIALVRNKR